jgi:isopropylmalate/homocitrate/citramalate synthase
MKEEGEFVEFWWKNLKQQEGIGRRRQKWEDNVKIDITQIVQKDVNSVHLFQDSERSRLC